jgi:FdrA protein
MIEQVDVRSGAYADSVRLMQVSQRVSAVEGVEAALVAMATELNIDVLVGMGFEAPDAGPNDLLVAVRATPEALDAALVEVDAALTADTTSGVGGFGDAPPPRTVRDAATLGGDLALVSVPGEHAFAEARDALDAGLHVMVYSDNVPIEQEIALKSVAAERGLLVMGPDAGTAIVGGLGLGFANVVRPGPVGIVAASGTGAQQLTCLLDEAGMGISHVLGLGGRDLSAEVGGASARQALRALDADPATELIVLLSKPPDAEVADRLREITATLDTPVVEALLGPDAPDLTACTDEVLDRLGHPPAAPASWPRAHAGGLDEVRGLFVGGTLCDEAMAIVGRTVGEVRSNVPLPGGLGLTDGLDTPGHVLVDLGEDEFTRGRPHPMIDQTLRVARLAVEAQRPGGRVLLLDVVLGHGAHPDPAAELGPAIEAALETRDDFAVVVSMCGTAADPQDRARQVDALVAAGASVHLSNAHAAREAAALVGGGS